LVAGIIDFLFQLSKIFTVYRFPILEGIHVTASLFSPAISIPSPQGHIDTRMVITTVCQPFIEFSFLLVELV